MYLKKKKETDTQTSYPKSPDSDTSSQESVDSCFTNISIEASFSLLPQIIINNKKSNIIGGPTSLPTLNRVLIHFVPWQAYLNRSYNSLELALNSPPKPHAFVSLPQLILERILRRLLELHWV